MSSEIKVHYPYCGSEEIARILYGYVLGWENSDKDCILGGCVVSGNDPRYYCHECEEGFGKPPVYREGDRGFDDRILLPDVVIGVEFTIGDYYCGHDTVRIVREGSSGAICVNHFPTAADDLFYVREYSEAEWKELMDKFFYELFVHEWKREYYNNVVPDRRQWNLVFHLKDGDVYSICGRHEYPPLFGELEKMFRDYMAQEVPLETDESKWTQFQYLFRNDSLVSGLLKSGRRDGFPVRV